MKRREESGCTWPSCSIPFGERQRTAAEKPWRAGTLIRLSSLFSAPSCRMDTGEAFFFFFSGPPGHGILSVCFWSGLLHVGVSLVLRLKLDKTGKRELAELKKMCSREDTLHGRGEERERATRGKGEN